MLLDVVYETLLYCNTFLVLGLGMPSFYYFIAVLAVVLGPATDYFCRTYSHWYITRSYEVLAIIMVPLLIGFGILMSANWFGLTTVVPYYENIEIEGVNSNEMLSITINYRNMGTSDAIITNIFIDGHPLSTYAAFIDVYDSSGTSIKNLLNGTGYLIPVGKEGKFAVMFTKDTFASGQVLNISLNTRVGANYTTSYKIP
jgi:hypothetical protein